MLRLIQVGGGLPISYPVDPTATFTSGMIAQLKLIGNDIVAGVSDGTAPLGIIDDVRSSAFTQPVVDEIVIIGSPDPSLIRTDGYNFYNKVDFVQNLDNGGIVQSSFVADYEGLILNPINGILTLPKDSILNWDSTGDGKNDSVKTICNYVYQVPNLPGDDTTIGSGRITIWFNRGIYATDQFDTLQRYPINATLFVNEEGKLTTQQLTANHPGVGIVVGSPSALISDLEFMYL